MPKQTPNRQRNGFKIINKQRYKNIDAVSGRPGRGRGPPSTKRDVLYFCSEQGIHVVLVVYEIIASH